MPFVGTRLSEEAHAYLEKTASQNSVSPSRALKLLVEFAAKADIDIRREVMEPNDEVRKMIEHIHMALPHLMYSSKVISTLMLTKVNETELAKTRQHVLQDMQQQVGDFQHATYRQNYLAKTQEGLTTMPIEAEVSQWKSS